MDALIVILEDYLNMCNYYEQQKQEEQDELREQEEREQMENREKRLWVEDEINRRRTQEESLLREPHGEHPGSFRIALRMTNNEFDKLLLLVSDKIKKRNTVMRCRAIPSRLKLEITLHYLASGDSFKSLASLFQLPVSTISIFLPEILGAMCETLEDQIVVSQYSSNFLWVPT